MITNPYKKFFDPAEGKQDYSLLYPYAHSLIEAAASSDWLL
jgi:hypothetical protein